MPVISNLLKQVGVVVCTGECAREVTCFSRFGYARPWIYSRLVVVWNNKTCCNEVTIGSDFYFGNACRRADDVE